MKSPLILAVVLLLSAGLQKVRAAEESGESAFPAEVSALIEQAKRQMQEGNVSGCLATWQRAVTTNLQSKGPRHLTTARVQTMAAAAMLSIGDIPSALPMLESARRILDQDYPKYPTRVWILSSLGHCYTETGNFPKAVEANEEGLREAIKFYGSKSRECAGATRAVADSYQHVQRLDDSMKLYDQSETMYVGLGLTNTIDFGVMQRNYGGAFLAQYKFSDAIHYYQRACDVHKVLGGVTLESARAIHDLGEAQTGSGNYSAAIENLKRSLDQFKQLVPGRKDEAIGLMSLATVYEIIGDLDHALDHAERAMSLFERLHAPPEDTAGVLNVVAMIHARRRDYAKATETYGRAVRILQALERPTRSSSQALGGIQSNLGFMQARAAQPELALKTLGAALENFDKVSNNLPERVYVQAAMAMANRVLHRYGDALALDKACLQFFTGVGGNRNPALIGDFTAAITFDQLGAGLKTEALQSARLAQEQIELAADDLVTFTSEEQRLSFRAFQHPFTIPCTLGSDDPRLPAQALIRLKGRMLDSATDDLRLSAMRLDASTSAIRDELQAARRRAARSEYEGTFGSSSQPSARAREDVARLQQKLARQVSQAGLSGKTATIGIGDVQRQIPPGAVLVDYVSYSRYDGGDSFSARFGAAVLRSQGGPLWVDLGPRAEISSNLIAYSQVMRADQADAKIVAALLHALYNQVWMPIQQVITPGITNLIISPDRDLHTLSWATLWDGKRFLGEVPNQVISYVSNARDLLRTPEVQQKRKTLAIWTNPDFDGAPADRAAKPLGSPAVSGSSANVLGPSGIFEELPLRWPPLTGWSRQWVARVGSQAKKAGFGVASYTDGKATEPEFCRVDSPTVLHVTTHGFYVPEKDESTGDTTSTFCDPFRTYKVGNSMWRGGLVMAGANSTRAAWQMGRTPDAGSDGYLFAAEIAMLDMKNTWLAVLSACQTGEGKVLTGEGVVGLGRAFAQAGVQNIVMTLWPVPENEASELADRFYGLALSGSSATAALATAQRERLAEWRPHDVWRAAKQAGPFIINIRGSAELKSAHWQN